MVLCVPKTQTGRNGRIVTDKLRSYGAALREIGYSGSHEQGLRANNRSERARAVSVRGAGNEIAPISTLASIQKKALEATNPKKK